MSEIGSVVGCFLVIILAVKEIICGDGTAYGYNRYPQLNNTDAWPDLGQKQQQNYNPWRTSQQNDNVWRRRGNSNFNQNNQNVNLARPSNGLQPSSPGPTSWSQPSSPGYVRQQVDRIETLNTAEVTDDELRDFSEKLLQKDESNPFMYVTARYQGKTTSRSTRDEAPEALLGVDDRTYSTLTVSKLKRLHDNYVLETTQGEDRTRQEVSEEDEFLDAVIATPVMEATRRFLIERGKLRNNPQDFKNLLQEIWFNMYARGSRVVSSSGFEHVFAAEIKNSQISGFHNWLFFKEKEDKNEVNYLGYMKVLSLGNKGAILKFHFTFHGIDKPVGSMFVGTSPELEMALYTTCFVLRRDNICPLKMNGNRFIIRTFTYRYRGKNMIGSAFPEI